jgi:hypothetical protein
LQFQPTIYALINAGLNLFVCHLSYSPLSDASYFQMVPMVPLQEPQIRIYKFCMIFRVKRNYLLKQH